MNATEVMNELIKYCAVADKEWHGPKLEMKNYEERAAEWAASGYEEDPENPQGQDFNPDEAGRFEIEFEESKNKRQTSFNGADALQRQRAVPNSVF
jgi:hypothetical protein